MVTYARTPQTTPAVVTTAAYEATPTEAHSRGSTETTALLPATTWLNEATRADLMCVSGIGEVLAERILARRGELGGFHSRAELMSVSGIGDALADRILAQFFLPEGAAPQTTPPARTTPPAVTTAPRKPQTDPPATTTAPPRPYLEMNHATYEELLTVPGMTQEFAEGYLELRTSIHGFSHPYELLLLQEVRKEASEAWLKSVFDCFYVEEVPQTQPAG